MQFNNCNSCSASEQDEAFFYSYETADITIVFKDHTVLENYSNIIISIRHLKTGRQIDLNAEESCDIDHVGGTMILHLTQEQTGKFAEGYVELQINILYDNSERDVTTKHEIKVYDNLHKKVMTI